MVLIFLPIYNEEKKLSALLDEIDAEMRQVSLEYKILAVNDGSTDGSEQILKEAEGVFPLIYINHSLNRGLWETVRDGFEKATEICRPGDVIVRMDADYTHHPHYILSMVKKISEGYDVVIASRFKGYSQKGVSLRRKILSVGAILIMKAFFNIKGVLDYSCGYRAYRASIIQDAIKIFSNNFIELKGLGFTSTVEKLIKIRKMKAKICEVPFELRYDLKESESKMVSRLTILGYLILIAKNIYPFGSMEKKYRELINKRMGNK